MLRVEAFVIYIYIGKDVSLTSAAEVCVRADSSCVNVYFISCNIGDKTLFMFAAGALMVFVEASRMFRGRGRFDFCTI